MTAPITGALGPFKTGSYSVSRRTTGTLTNGRVTPAVATTYSVDGVLFPAGPQELLRLEEGERSHEARVLITSGSLRTAGNGFEADVVTVGADTYQVAGVEDWTSFGFIKATLVRRGHA